jgi:hypothetical protein
MADELKSDAEAKGGGFLDGLLKWSGIIGGCVAIASL